MDTIDISVIVPSYRPQSYLWECLDSLGKQTFDPQNFEIIIILNGCCEPYASEIEAYIAAHLSKNIVRFVQTDRPGVSNARNVGLDLAQGKFIGFIDDDDYVSPTYLQELYDIAVTGIVPVSNIIAFKEGETRCQSYYLTDLFRKNMDKGPRSVITLRSYMSIPVCKIIPRETIGIRRFDVRFKNGEDGLFMFAVSDKIGQLCCTSPNAVYYRRYRPGSAVMKPRTKRDRFENCLCLIRAYSCIFFSGHYSFLFYCTRVLAELKSIVGHLSFKDVRI